MLRPTLQSCLGCKFWFSAWFFRFLNLRLVRWRKGVWVSTVSANGGQRTSSFVLDSVKDEAIPRKCEAVKSNFVYSLTEKLVLSKCRGLIGTLISDYSAMKSFCRQNYKSLKKSSGQSERGAKWQKSICKGIGVPSISIRDKSNWWLSVIQANL